MAAVCLVGWMLAVPQAKGPMPPARAAASSAKDGEAGSFHATRSTEGPALPADKDLSSAPDAEQAKGTAFREREASALDLAELRGTAKIPLPSAAVSPGEPRRAATVRRLSARREMPAASERPEAEIRAAQAGTKTVRSAAPVQPASAFAFSVAAEPRAPEPEDAEPPSAAHRAGPLSRDEF
jgi:hypothetical protein